MKLALFDFDGTLTVRDTFTPFLRFAVSRRRAVVGGLLISPVLVAHRLRLLSTPATRPMVARASFRGASAPNIRALGERYAADALPAALASHAMARVRWHQAQGDQVVVVSAGLDVYLAPWCAIHRVALICSELEERDGVMTGRYRRGDCSGATKAALVRATFDLSAYDQVYAYGDTEEDLEMLGLAHRRYFRWAEMEDGWRPRSL